MSDAVETAEEQTEWVFVAPDARSLRFRLPSGKVNFENGQLILTDKHDAETLLGYLKTKPSISALVQYVNKEMAEEISMRFQRRQASLGGTNTDTLADMARTVLHERDITMASRANNPALAKELAEAEAGVDGITLTEESPVQPVDHSAEGFVPNPVKEAERKNIANANVTNAVLGDDNSPQKPANPIAAIMNNNNNGNK